MDAFHQQSKLRLLNLSHNLLQRINFLPEQLMVLDLSHNEISEINTADLEKQIYLKGRGDMASGKYLTGLATVRFGFKSQSQWAHCEYELLTYLAHTPWREDRCRQALMSLLKRREKDDAIQLLLSSGPQQQSLKLWDKKHSRENDLLNCI